MALRASGSYDRSAYGVPGGVAVTNKLVMLWACTCLSCVVVAHRGPRAEVSSPPPAPAYEPPVACDPGYVRVPGHWQWNGYQYVWIPQRCVYRPGYRYEEGGYYACDDGYCYREGTWVNVTTGVIVTP
jgi:hypothetical protein